MRAKNRARVTVAVATAAMLALPWVFSAAHAAGPPTFSDATASSGIRYRNVCGAKQADKGWLTESMGAGAGWLDFDGDGNLDLYLVNGSSYDKGVTGGEPNQLYRGNGKGTFTEVGAKAGVDHRGWGFGITVGDYDNDGDPDLYVTNYAANVLYRNDGDGTFTDVTANAGVGHAEWSSSAAFFDMEGDGDLDLYVGNYMVADPAKVPRRGTEGARMASCMYKAIPVYCGPMGQVPLQDVLYRNNGDGTFTDVTVAAGVQLETPRYALGVVAADYDNDGDTDLYVANDSVFNSLWQNDGTGKFTDVGVGKGVALNADGRAQAGMGTDFGDYNGDGWLDIVVTNFAHDLNTIYRSLGGKFFMDESSLGGLGITNLMLSWGAGFADFDRDADLDLFIANGHIYPEVDAYELGTRYRQRNHLFVNDGGKFRESSAQAGKGFAIERSFRGAAFGDYDNDGDVDLFLTALDDDGLLLRNDAKGGHWLELLLVGASANRDAVGARVSVTAGGVTQIRERKGGGSYLSANDPRLHFGLGAATKIDKVEIRWPGGKVQTLTDIPVDRVVRIRQGAGVIE